MPQENEKCFISKMSPQRFLDHIAEGYFEAQERFCFILGAGASRNSGIRTATELMKEWRAYLLDDKRGPSYIRECAKEIGMNDPNSYEYIFSSDYVFNSNDYFTLFELRFAGRKNVAYHFLEREMTGTDKFPSYGFFSLGSLLSDTENRLVITTNFDSMVEDALFFCRGLHPLVIGHEKLAAFISGDQNKPIIAKVHRDLLYQPMNTAAEMQKLQAEWKNPLSDALAIYTPIVIGYAGADHTLMSLLEELPLKGIYWCGIETEPPKRIEKLLGKNHGYWVKIDGFDEIMYRLEARFLQDERFAKTYKRPDEYMKEHTKEQLERYSRQKEKLAGDTAEVLKRQMEENRKESSETSASQRTESAEELKAKAAMVEALTAEGEKTESASDLLMKIYVAFTREQYDDALQLCNQAIELDPGNAEYYNSRGVTLHEMGRYSKALADKEKAIGLDPGNARYYNSRGVTLHAMGRYDEALADKDKAIELDPDNAEDYGRWS